MAPVTSLGPPPVPPLRDGDRLTRDEFERRYDAMPTLKKAELIEGVVHLPSPVRIDQHASPHAALIGWLFTYWAATPGVRAGDNASVRLDLGNEPQPDALLFIEAAHLGQARIDADGYVEDAPELVAEVSASSANFDLTVKLPVYQRNGVREYIVWRVLDRAVDWFVLRSGQYAPLPLSPAGLHQSEVFPGLWLDPTALVNLDLPAVLGALRQGLAGPEHADFVSRLRAPGP